MLQTYNYQNSPVTFSKDGEVMVNATQMAKPFGKLTANFLQTQQTKDFITALENHYCNSNTDRYGISHTKIVQVINGGTNPGTWMHQKLALKFAAWLSPEFELWVYDRVEELLTTGKTEITPLSDAEMKLQVFRMLEAEAESLKDQLQLANTTIKAQAPVVMYAEKVLQSTNCYTTTTIAKELGFGGAQGLNNMLKNLKVQYFHNGHWVLYQQHQGKGYTQTRTHTFYDKLNNQQSSLQTVWTEKGRAFIHKQINAAKSAA
jgi:phage antirepressor YoqD-like protein